MSLDVLRSVSYNLRNWVLTSKGWSSPQHSEVLFPDYDHLKVPPRRICLRAHLCVVGRPLPLLTGPCPQDYPTAWQQASARDREKEDPRWKSWPFKTESWQWHPITSATSCLSEESQLIQSIVKGCECKMVRRQGPLAATAEAAPTGGAYSDKQHWWQLSFFPPCFGHLLWISHGTWPWHTSLNDSCIRSRLIRSQALGASENRVIHEVISCSGHEVLKL